MRIKKINIFKKNLSLTRPYSIAYQTVTEVENVFVEIHLQNGMIGLGAANPSKEVVGEDVNDAFANMQTEPVQRLRGRDIAEIFGIIQELQQTFPHAPGTRAALDMALHDAFCQYLNLSVAQFYHQKIQKLPTSVTIGIKDVSATLAEAKEYFDAGFRALKVKIGLDMETDIERLFKLRERFGKHFQLRVDANQGYTLTQVLSFFERTQSLNLELVEQPTPVGTEAAVAQLPLSIRQQLVADESLQDAQTAFQLAAQQVFGIFNIKLMKCGGIFKALEIANIAKVSNINLFWGCNDESIISITAALHAAYACPNTRFIDLDGSFDLAEDIVQTGFVLKEGYMLLPPRTGLGFL